MKQARVDVSHFFVTEPSLYCLYLIYMGVFNIMGDVSTLLSVKERYGLPEFIETERQDVAGESAELRVWNAVKSAFTGRSCLAYWQFPIFRSGKNQKLPDILIADQELGIVIIEVKSFRIEQMVAIQGYRWELQRHHSKYEYPYRQASSQAQALLDELRSDPLLSSVSARAIIALPHISSEEWLAAGYYNIIGAPPVLCEDNLSRASLLNTIRDANCLVTGDALDDTVMEALLRSLGGHKPVVQEDLSTYTGRGKVIKKVAQTVKQFDIDQEIISKQIPPGPQRIRGIAGSGKTILLCQKAVQMHLRHPDWDIALVFFTSSLYDLMLRSLETWMRHFTGGQQGYDPANSKLQVMHAWGRYNQPGFYRKLAQAHGLKPKSVKDLPQTKRFTPSEGYAFVLHDLLMTLQAQGRSIIPMFDAVLVDEGQDLVFNEVYKFEGKQPFYWLAYQSLRPARMAAEARALFEAEAAEVETAGQRRLIWAYDEAQSLDALIVPSYKEVFGEKVSQAMLAGGVHYPGNIAKHEVIRRCYRTPETILVAAHAIGMGLLRPEGTLAAISNRTDWQKLGYEVEGDFRRIGSTITLRRPKENSPNPMPQAYGKSVLTFRTTKTRQDEIELVAAMIKNDIREGLSPSRNLLVVLLGDTFEVRPLREKLGRALSSLSIPFYIPSMPHANLFKCDWRDKKPDRFWYDNAVTISTVHQAKGNEADVVYILGFDNTAKREAEPNARNQVFVALTRSKGFAHLSGVGNYPLFDEMNNVIRSGTTLNFTFTRAGRQLSDEDLLELDNA